MLSGALSMINLTRSLSQAHKSSSLNYPLVIWPLNTSLIEVCSVLVEYKLMILTDSPRPLVVLSKPQSMDLLKMSSEHAVYSKRLKSVTRDITCSRDALVLNHAPLSSEEVLINTLKKPRDHLMTLLWSSEEQSRLMPSLPVVVPSRWNSPDSWENTWDLLVESNNWLSMVSPRHLRLSPRLLLRTPVWTPLMCSTNSDKSTPKMPMRVSGTVLMLSTTESLICTKNSSGNQNLLELT